MSMHFSAHITANRSRPACGKRGKLNETITSTTKRADVTCADCLVWLEKIDMPAPHVVVRSVERAQEACQCAISESQFVGGRWECDRCGLWVPDPYKPGALTPRAKPAECPRCTKRGKPDDVSEPRCAFIAGKFDPNHYACATMDALRTMSGIWNDPGANGCVVTAMSDQSCGVIPTDEGEFIVLSWYKNRGRTEGAWLVDEGRMEVLTLEKAEEVLA